MWINLPSRVNATTVFIIVSFHGIALWEQPVGETNFELGVVLLTNLSAASVMHNQPVLTKVWYTTPSLVVPPNPSRHVYSESEPVPPGNIAVDWCTDLSIVMRNQSPVCVHTPFHRLPSPLSYPVTWGITVQITVSRCTLWRPRRSITRDTLPTNRLPLVWWLKPAWCWVWGRRTRRFWPRCATFVVLVWIASRSGNTSSPPDAIWRCVVVMSTSYARDCQLLYLDPQKCGWGYFSTYAYSNEFEKIQNLMLFCVQQHTRKTPIGIIVYAGETVTFQSVYFCLGNTLEGCE